MRPIHNGEILPRPRKLGELSTDGGHHFALSRFGLRRRQPPLFYRQESVNLISRRSRFGLRWRQPPLSNTSGDSKREVHELHHAIGTRDRKRWLAPPHSKALRAKSWPLLHERSPNQPEQPCTNFLAGEYQSCFAAKPPWTAVAPATAFKHVRSQQNRSSRTPPYDMNARSKAVAGATALQSASRENHGHCGAKDLHASQNTMHELRYRRVSILFRGEGRNKTRAARKRL